jgi:TrpR-related protein YerC/YecD
MSNALHDLCKAFLNIESEDELRLFLMDLCTPQELNALTERWRVCLLLDKRDLTYRQIAHITGASLTTISRVARALRTQSHGGYPHLLKKLSHINPEERS